MIHKLAIIGAGPAGLAAALQLKRFGIDFIWFEKNKIGGLLHNANLIENYLGFPKGVKGEKLINLFIDQIANLNIEPIFDEVNLLDYRDDIFTISTINDTYKVERIILASGTIPIRLSFKSIEVSKRVFYEVYDLRETSGSDIVIVGAGDAAFDYAINLSRTNKVTILNRSAKIKALKVLVDRVTNNNNITYLTNTDIKSITIKNGKLLLTCNSEKSKLEINTDYLLIAIGRKPNNEFLSKSIFEDYKELVKKKKLFPIGDIKNENKRQTSISTGDGIKTAMEIFELLTSEK